jgi:ADP-dependent NAD(P)H-hydrate dehydratase
VKTGKPLNRTTLRPHPLPPVIDGDKESKGRLLVIAGSREVPGAALLAASAAMRAGAGKLRIATAASIATAVGVAMPEAMVIAVADESDGGFRRSGIGEIEELAAKSDAVVGGPGLKQNNAGRELAAVLLRTNVRVALDAALLHELAPSESTRDPLPILLPHAGELASLLGLEEEDIERDPIGCGLRAADRHGAIVLVKGVTSHIVTPDGDVWTYRGGTPGLGVSGSGDVLAGIVGGLLARGAEPLNALLWAVWLHGEAGTRLAKSVGKIGFLAREIPGAIPALLPR